MRLIEPDFLDQEEIAYLLKTPRGLHKLKSSSNPVVDKVVERLRRHFNFEINSNSYWRIEEKPDGHEWHKDTGSNDHMLWCQVGVSIVLTNNFTGGETFYADDAGETNVVKQNRKIGDLCAHTSTEWHMVTPHQGRRTVFLMFI
jgi:hypothetical protein